MRTDSLAPFLAALLLFTAPQAATAAHSRQKAPLAIPSDAELERSGAVIGSIDILNENIFDLANPKDDNWLFRVADRLHPVTRKQTIREQLLFHTGERYSRHLLEESARILRANPYFYDASVEPVAYHDGKVDIRVLTRDVWTLNPGFNYSRSGGTNRTGFQIEEANILGTGTDVKLDHTTTVDRTESDIQVMNPHTFGTWFTTDLAYGTLSDGKMREFILDRPFYALETRHAGGISLNDSTQDDSLYDLGQEVDRFADHTRFFQVYGGFSNGLDNGWTRRYSAGLNYDEHTFAESNAWTLPTVLPQGRKFVYPWLRFDLVQDEWAKVRNHNQIGRTEDFDMGAYATVQVGWADSALGSSRDAIPFELAAGDGYELHRGNKLLVSSVFTGRVEKGSLENGVLSSAVRFYDEQSGYWPFREGNWLFFSTLASSVGKRLDLENQILLGGDNGLRGYPLRYQDGTSRALLSLEERYFSDWYPFRLFRVGAAVFFDMGRTWGGAVLGQPNSSLGMLKDAGFGLRFGNARTGLGNVIHVDLAFPFDSGPTNIRKVQFLVQTEQEF
ncbi:MAG: BamA/TamA family outer membrane protein [Steroidobacteraceae bacterium]